MTVEELIEILSQLPPGAEVTLNAPLLVDNRLSISERVHPANDSWPPEKSPRPV